MFLCILQRLYGALRVLASVFVHFTKTLWNSTGARVCFCACYKDSTELCGCSYVFSCIFQRLYRALQVVACVFVHFTRTLRSSTGARVCFLAFYKGSTELYGCSHVFSCVYKSPTELYGCSCVFSAVYKGSTELYGGSRVFRAFYKDSTTLRGSTGGALCFRKIYESSKEFNRWLYVVSKVLRWSTELYGWCCVFLEVLQGFYGALCLALCVFASFTRVLRSSTGDSLCFARL